MQLAVWPFVDGITAKHGVTEHSLKSLRDTVTVQLAHAILTVGSDVSAGTLTVFMFNTL